MAETTTTKKKATPSQTAAGNKKKPAKRSPRKRKAKKKGLSERFIAWLTQRLYQKGETRTWVIWTLTALIGCFYLLAVYHFFLQPYAEGKKEVEIHFLSPHVHGLDVSHYQGSIDWPRLSLAAYKEQPVNFVFMKATEGTDFVDHTFQHNFASARECGMVRGAYHFFRPDVSAEKQAELFITHVKLGPGDLPPVLDIEVLGRKGNKALQQGVRTWLQRVEQHYGVKPIIYASYKFKLRHLNDPFFDAYPFWIAHYHVSQLEYTGPWKFWQHTDSGQLDGIEGDVDLNIFNGSLEELMKMTIK